MTVYEIPNIEHCTVTLIGSMYRIVANDGWYIHIIYGDEAVDNIYKGAVILQSTFDFSTVEIIPESELPEGAEILGGNNNAEIM